MPILTLCNHKGGTGKTTTAIHLAAALGLLGNKTLVIDLDPQSYLTDMLNLKQTIPDEDTSMALFGLKSNLDQMNTLKTTNFEVIPSSRGLSKVQKNLTKPTDVLWLKEVLREPSSYDWILIDTAAAITPLTLNALVASDMVIIPMVPEFQSYVGAQQTMKTCALVKDKLNPDLHDPYIVLTKVDGRTLNHRRIQQQIRNQFGSRVLKAVVRTDTVLSEKNQQGKTVFDKGKGKKITIRAAIDYTNVIDELMKRLQIA